MNTMRRPSRFIWLLGIVLLVGTAAGAGWVLNHAPAGTPVPQSSDRQRVQPGADNIICIGYVDVPGGTTPLYPLQPGRVSEVWVEEGDKVWEGALLFRMDDRLAREQLEVATADLLAAEGAKAEAESLRKMHKEQVALQIKGQKAAVKVAQAAARAQAKAVVVLQKLLDSGTQGSSEELEAAKEKEQAFLGKVEVEEAKLEAIKEMDFAPKLRQAEANIKAKKATVEKARLALLECDVYAPADGTVLRMFITPDQVLGPDPKLPAVEFCPAVPRIVRTEVQQEWGSRVEVGQPVIIEDNTRAGFQWTGRVARISEWYTKRRSKLLEPFQFNDVRTLECIVSVDPGQRHMRIGQRMRVIIKQGGP